MNSLPLKHIITVRQFLRRELTERVFDLADRFRSAEIRKRLPGPLKSKLMASVFYEPSTRTRFSFEAAMLRLGGEVISTESAGHFSSAIKGESLEDTIRVIGGYADVIVLRHYERGAAARAAAVSQVPVINAGDGSGEHPTQALLDLYTIKKEFGRIDDVTIAMAGDLRYGRTVHSLIQLFSLCKKVKVVLVSPKELKLPQEYKTFLNAQNMRFSETEHLDDVLPHVDVLYMTRIQKERFSSPRLFEKMKNAFVVNKETLTQLRKSAIIMHPFPRVNEISPEVDADPRARYFQQARNGLYVRMALLKLLLKR